MGFKWLFFFASDAREKTPPALHREALPAEKKEDGQEFHLPVEGAEEPIEEQFLRMGSALIRLVSRK
jgi:hypothetical protein